MKREFLQNFKVNDQPLTKEIIDAIMAENGRDIEAAKKPFADYDSLKDQLQTAKDSLKAFEGMDVQKLQGQIAQLQADLAAKDADHQAKLADLAFDRALEDAINGAKGRNAKAIKATIVRPLPSGAMGERDVYGAQQHAPLANYVFDLP